MFEYSRLSCLSLHFACSFSRSTAKTTELSLDMAAFGIGSVANLVRALAMSVCSMGNGLSERRPRLPRFLLL